MNCEGTPALSDEELTALEQTVAQATPGPWGEDDGLVVSLNREHREQRLRLLGKELGLSGTLVRRYRKLVESFDVPAIAREMALSLETVGAVCTLASGFVIGDCQRQPDSGEDAVFIATARSAVPELLAAVRLWRRPDGDPVRGGYEIQLRETRIAVAAVLGRGTIRGHPSAGRSMDAPAEEDPQSTLQRV